MKVDVTIVGGGLVGLATALLLSQKGFTVCILDMNPCVPTSLSKSYESRVSAITLASVELFSSLGTWDTIKNLRVGRFEKIKIWEDQNSADICFDPARGYIIENKVIQLALIEKLKIAENVEIIDTCKIEKIAKSQGKDGCITVLLSDNQNIESKIIIGADGANSKIREWAELGLTETKYNQSALIATVHTGFSHGNIAGQRFLPEGPLAFLPLSQENYCSIVWTNTPEVTKKLLESSEVDFNLEINKVWGNSLGEIRLEGQRFAFGLSKKHAERYVTDRVALVGDAAHAIHPLAGQGVNLGFLDAKCLAEVLMKSKNQNRDIGLLHTLRKYERARKGDNLLVQKLMDVFNTNWIRKIGFKITSNSNFLKNSMALWMTQREK
jgi:2-octaprenylphenol hydroxylase